MRIPMGHKFSATNGVKSDNYHEPNNAINEIWYDNKVELISRLPFGASDLEQASWPKGEWPKIPWKNFIFPLKRSLSSSLGGLDKGQGLGHYATATATAAKSMRAPIPPHADKSDSLTTPQALWLTLGMLLGFLPVLCMMASCRILQTSPPEPHRGAGRKAYLQARAIMATAYAVCGTILAGTVSAVWTTVMNVLRISAKETWMKLLMGAWVFFWAVAFGLAVYSSCRLWNLWKNCDTGGAAAIELDARARRSD